MGGLFRHVRDLAVAHQQSGHQVGVICDVAGTPGYNEAMVAELSERLTLGLHRTQMRRAVGPGDIMDSRNILKIIKELQPNVLHGHGAKGGVFARALGSLARVERSRVARLYSPHGGSLHYGAESRSGRLYFRIERMLEGLTDHILFVADFERRTYAEKIGEPSCAWSVNYNGLQPAEFEPVTPDEDAADFLFLGELRELKGPDIFLRALAELRAEGREAVRGVIVGDGPDADETKALARELHLDDAVSFHPPMPARQAFAKGRCFVMPSRAEAMPYVVLEALAADLPVIAANVGGIPEIFGAGSPTLITPETGDAARLMRIALDDPEMLAGWQPARAELRSRFSVETMAANVLKAYRSALTIRTNGGAATERLSSVS